jgi:3-oxoacyl-[acyl-carrier-protein] synthase II
MAKRTLANSGRRVVITGLGCVSPLGNTVEDTWKALIEGKSGAGFIQSFDASSLDVRFACEVKGFDPNLHVPKKDQRRMDRFILLGFSAAAQALENARLTSDAVNPERVAVLLASGMGGLPGIEEQFKSIMNGGRMSPFFIPQVIPNMLAGQISIHFGFKGANYSIASACSSSAHAIGEAARLIERGDADYAIAGGSEAAISPLGIHGFAAMKALSTRNDAPEKASRPFDKDRDGFVMGEGGAALVLESLESAERRGATILAEIAGYGANSDAYHMTSPSEAGEGGARCMKLALEDAGLRPDQVDVVNMHGTSTPVGDVAESQALIAVFGDHAKKLYCTSSKSMTGHLLGGAGAIEALFSALYIRDQVVSPTINLDNQDEKCTLNYTPHKAVKTPVNVVVSNSFGFGGTNATLILKRFVN